MRCTLSGQDTCPSPHWPALTSLETQLGSCRFPRVAPNSEPLCRLPSVPRDLLRHSASAFRCLPLSVCAKYSQSICKIGAAEQKQSQYVTFVASPASGIYPSHSSIHLLNEPCQYSFPFLLLQLLSLNPVIDDAFGFLFLLHMQLVCMENRHSVLFALSFKSPA